LFLVNSNQIFTLCLQKKNYRNIASLQHRKNICRKCFCFTSKICLCEISCVHRKQDFSLFLLMVGLSSGLNRFCILKFLYPCLDLYGRKGLKDIDLYGRKSLKDKLVCKSFKCCVRWHPMWKDVTSSSQKHFASIPPS
jgi:hypothetical protein